MRIIQCLPKLRITFIILISFFCQFGFSQSESGYTFQNIYKGLPSKEVYSIAQDDYGYIWFGTERGIARFDGHEFVNFGIEEGLNDPTVFKLLKNGKLIWFKCFNGDIGVIEDFKIKIVKSYPSADYKLLQLYSSGENVIVTWSGKDRIVNYDVLSKTGEVLQRELGAHDSLILKPIEPNSLVVYGNLKGINNQGIQIKDKNILSFPETISLGSTFSTWKFDDIYYLYSNNKIIKMNSNGIMEMELNSISTSTNFISVGGEFWLGSFDGILKTSSQNLNEVDYLLRGQSISDIIQDVEGNYWASTLNNGVFYIKKTSVVTIVEGSVSLLKSNGRQVYFRKDNKLGLIENQDLQKVKYFDVGFPICDIYLKENKVFVKPLRRGVKFKPIDGVSYIKIPGGKIIANSEDNFTLLNKRVLTSYYSLENYKSQIFEEVHGRNIFDVFTLNDSVFWFSNLEGCYQVTYIKNENAAVAKLTDSPLRKIESNGDYVFGALKGVGLLVYDNDWNVLDTLNKSKGLSSNFISDIICYKNSNVLFLATSEGIDVLKYLPKNKPEIYNRITTQNGLLTNDIRELCLVGNKLLIASLSGLQQIDVTLFFTPKKESLILNILKLNDEYVISKKRVELLTGVNYVKIQFTALSYNNLQTRTVEYRIIELSEEWSQTRNNFIDYANLSSGEYTLQVRIPNSDKPEDIKSLVFVVSSPFYKSTGFIVLMVNLIIAMVFIGFHIKSRIANQRLKIDIENARLRQVALTARLNPHILFNTLGGIQTLILKKENDKAVEFITKFSTLMRHILRRSEEDYTPLADEIAFINNFMDVENLKYSMKTSIVWKVDKKIDKYDVQIPSMFLQPIIENSIKHGFLYYKNDGTITISLSIIKTGVMQIIIEDDGKGLTKKENVKGDRVHSSELLKKRIELMQQVSHKGYNLIIEDKKDKDDKLSGIKITLKLPYVTI